MSKHRLQFTVMAPGDTKIFKLEEAVKRVFRDFDCLDAQLTDIGDPGDATPATSRQRVKQFHEVFGHPVAANLTAGTPDLRVLRVKLLLEEVLELAEALCVNVFTGGVGPDSLETPVTANDLRVYNDPHATRAPNLTEAADALGDIDYVCHGAALVFGINLDAVGKEVHRSNMSKLGSDGKPIYREDGKVLKGPGYFKPNIAGVLAKKHSGGS